MIQHLGIYERDTTSWNL